MIEYISTSSKKHFLFLNIQNSIHVQSRALLFQYSNQNHITWINTQASPTQNYLILGFTMKWWYRCCCCCFVCVCVCMYVCACVYFLGFSWLNKSINVMPDTQVSDGMLRKYFGVKYICRHVIDNHSRNLQASNGSKECQLNQGRPQDVKDNSYKLSKL